MTIYRPENRIALAEILPETRLSNQIVFTGATGNKLDLQKGIVFIEYVKATSGTTVSVKNGKGITLLTGLTEFSQDHSPLRCDYGVELIGTLECAKGFVMDGILLS